MVTTEKRFLLVARSPTLRDIIARRMSRLGYRFDMLGAFEQASQLLRIQLQRYDGIIMAWPSEKQGAANSFLKFLSKKSTFNTRLLLLSGDLNTNLLNWTAGRPNTAILTWENFVELGDTIRELFASDRKAPSVDDELSESNIPVRVLFVDDSLSVRSYYRRVLEQNHYQVDTASSAAEAIQRVKAINYDLIISDYFMPDIDGAQLCRILRQNIENNSIRIVMITGSYIESVISDCLDAGASECLFKNEAQSLFISRMNAIRRSIGLQRTIEKEREKLATVLNAVGDGVVGVDRSGHITFVNTSALKVLGYPRESALRGKLAITALHGESNPQSPSEQNSRLQKTFMEGLCLERFNATVVNHARQAVDVQCNIFTLPPYNGLEESILTFSVRALEETLSLN